VVGAYNGHSAKTSGPDFAPLGCGLNVRNTGTVTSLAQLLPPDLAGELSIERTAAVIMAKFERMWTMFVAYRGSFEPFMDLYLERWLHS
jgi:biotin--protein ligase